MTKPKTAKNPFDRKELRVTTLNDRRRTDVAVDASRAKYTPCKPFVDARFAVAPGHVGEFARAGIGRYLEDA